MDSSRYSILLNKFVEDFVCFIVKSTVTPKSSVLSNLEKDLNLVKDSVIKWAIERAPACGVTSGDELETVLLNLSYALLKKVVQDPKLYSIAIFVQGWVFNCTERSYFTEGKREEKTVGLATEREEKTMHNSGVKETQGASGVAEETAQKAAEKNQLSTTQPSLDLRHVVFNEERKRNPINEVEHRLPFYEGKCPKTKGAMTNLDEWIKRVEDLTHDEVWNDDGKIRLALRRLRGDALGTYEAWYARAKDVDYNWKSLADELRVVHDAVTSTRTALDMFLGARREGSESLEAYFNKLRIAAEQVKTQDREFAPLVENMIGIVFARELPEEFFDACPGLVKTKDCRTFFQEYRVWAKQNKATDYRREAVKDDTLKKRVVGAIAKEGSRVPKKEKNVDGGKVESRNVTLTPEMLNKQVEVRKKPVDKTGDERININLKRNVTMDDSITCGYCQRRGHGTDKCQFLSARIASSSAHMGRGRGRPTMICGYCQKTGHTMDRCFLFDQKLRGVSGTRQKVEAETKCFNCGKFGHFARNCPEQKPTSKN